MPRAETVPPQRPAEQAQARAILASADHVDRLLADALRTAAPGSGVSGLTPALILCELDRTGPTRPTHLQEVTGLTSGGVTKTLDRLEAHGLIARRARVFPDDRRGVSVELTREGMAVAAAICAAIMARQEGLREAASALGTILGVAAGR